MFVVQTVRFFILLVLENDPVFKVMIQFNKAFVVNLDVVIFR